MKKIEFKTSKGEFVLVEKDENGKLIHPNCEHVEYGRISEITEQKASEIVDESIFTGLFAHYVKDIPVNTYCYKNALDSFHILLESLGVLWENPYQSDWDELCEWGHGGFAKDGKTEFELYHEAQQKVWNKSTTYLFRNERI